MVEICGGWRGKRSQAMDAWAFLFWSVLFYILLAVTGDFASVKSSSGEDGHSNCATGFAITGLGSSHWSSTSY